MHAFDTHREQALPHRHGTGLPWTLYVLALLFLALCSTSWAGEARNERPNTRKTGLADELAMRRSRGTVIWPRGENMEKDAASTATATDGPEEGREPTPPVPEPGAGDSGAGPIPAGNEAAAAEERDVPSSTLAPGGKSWPVRRSPEECADRECEEEAKPAGRRGERSGDANARDRRVRKERKSRQEARTTSRKRTSGPWWRNDSDSQYEDTEKVADGDGRNDSGEAEFRSREGDVSGDAKIDKDEERPRTARRAPRTPAGKDDAAHPEPLAERNRESRAIRDEHQGDDSDFATAPFSSPSVSPFLSPFADSREPAATDAEASDPNALRGSGENAASEDAVFWSGLPAGDHGRTSARDMGESGEPRTAMAGVAADPAVQSAATHGIAVQPAPTPPTREEVEAYRMKLEDRLLERYNNLPEYAGRVGKVRVILSRPVEESIDGLRIRAEFDQLVYDPWGKRMPQLEEEYYVVTFGVGGAREVRSDPSIRIGLDLEKTYSETAPLAADPFRNVEPSRAFTPAPRETMPDWWRPEY